MSGLDDWERARELVCELVGRGYVPELWLDFLDVEVSEPCRGHLLPEGLDDPGRAPAILRDLLEFKARQLRLMREGRVAEAERLASEFASRYRWKRYYCRGGYHFWHDPSRLAALLYLEGIVSVDELPWVLRNINKIVITYMYQLGHLEASDKCPRTGRVKPPTPEFLRRLDRLVGELGIRDYLSVMRSGWR